MYYRTTGEILKAALHLSGTHNQTFETFQVSIDYLNTIYREVYSMVCDERDDYCISTYTSHDNRTELPEDLMIIKSVGLKTGDGIIHMVEKCPDNTMLPNTYATENNILEYFGDMVGKTLIIRYCPTPKTLTFPSPDRQISIPDTATSISMDDAYVYYSDNGQNYRLDINSDSTEYIETLPAEPTEWEWHGQVMTVDENMTVYADDEPTDIFVRYDKNDNEIPLTAIHFDGNYCMVSYADKRIYIHDGYTMSRWNIKEQTGKETLGIILALCTNDITGYGCIYRDTKGKTTLSSFLTDTVLDYPNNTLFQYMEFRLASLFAMLNGMQNPFLEQGANEARLAMMKELKRNRGSHGRIRNTITPNYY